MDLIEGSGVLKPVLRWRIPTPVLQRLFAENDDCKPTGDAANTKAAEGAQILHAFGTAQSRWGKPNTPKMHPLDDPRSDAAMFVEDVASVVWTSSTYNPVEVRRFEHEQPYSYALSCIPLFRQWQALHLVELFLSEARCFAGIDRATLAEQWPDLAPSHTSWRPETDTEGFVTHRAVLEALSWHATYVQHASDLAQVSAPNYGLFATANGSNAKDDGHSVIQGAALKDLKKEESRIAHEALDRHSVDEAAVLRAASWLGASAKRRRDAGHENASRAYANLMREAVELLINLGHTLDRVKQDMQNGATLIDLSFPVWSKKAGEDLRRQILFCAKDLNSWSDPSIGVFDEAQADEMIEWLEQEGLFAAHFSIQALIEVGQRPGRKADVAVAAHLANLAAWLEHVCNGLQDPNQQFSTTTLISCNKNKKPNFITLEQKIPGCFWNVPTLKSTFDNAWGKRCIPKTKVNLDDRVHHLLQTPASSKVDFLALQARVAMQIRNESMHQGLAALSRYEIRDAAQIVLRTAMAMWLIGH